MKFEYKGYLFSVLSAVIFGLMPIMAKNIYSHDINSISLVFYRSFLSAPVLCLLSIHANENIMKINSFEIKKILILVAGYTLTPLLLYSSYNYISSGPATTIHFGYPVFILLGSVLIYKSKVHKIEVVCAALCTAGILLITDFREINNIVGVILAFLSGITHAFYTLYFEKSGLKEMNTYKVSFYMTVFSSVIVIVYAALTGKFILIKSAEGWILSFVFSILVTVFAVVFYQNGIKKIGAQKASILSTFEPLTSIIIGIAFLKESLNLLNAFAIILILSSAIVLISFSVNTHENK